MLAGLQHGVVAPVADRLHPRRNLLFEGLDEVLESLGLSSEMPRQILGGGKDVVDRHLVGRVGLEDRVDLLEHLRRSGAMQAQQEVDVDRVGVEAPQQLELARHVPAPLAPPVVELVHLRAHGLDAEGVAGEVVSARHFETILGHHHGVVLEVLLRPLFEGEALVECSQQAVQLLRIQDRRSPSPHVEGAEADPFQGVRQMTRFVDDEIDVVVEPAAARDAEATVVAEAADGLAEGDVEVEVPGGVAARRRARHLPPERSQLAHRQVLRCAAPQVVGESRGLRIAEAGNQALVDRPLPRQTRRPRGRVGRCHQSTG